MTLASNNFSIEELAIYPNQSIQMMDNMEIIGVISKSITYEIHTGSISTNTITITDPAYSAYIPGKPTIYTSLNPTLLYKKYNRSASSIYEGKILMLSSYEITATSTDPGLLIYLGSVEVGSEHIKILNHVFIESHKDIKVNTNKKTRFSLLK